MQMVAYADFGENGSPELLMKEEQAGKIPLIYFKGFGNFYSYYIHTILTHQKFRDPKNCISDSGQTGSKVLKVNYSDSNYNVNKQNGRTKLWRKNGLFA
jgi:hypothetical protein